MSKLPRAPRGAHLVETEDGPVLETSHGSAYYVDGDELHWDAGFNHVALDTDNVVAILRANGYQVKVPRKAKSAKVKFEPRTETGMATGLSYRFDLVKP